MSKSAMLRAKGKQLLKEAAELELKEKQEKILQAGELCKGYFDNNFSDFSHDKFIGLVKGIFADATTESKSKPVSKSKAKAEPEQVEAKPKPETESQAEAGADTKKKWF